MGVQTQTRIFFQKKISKYQTVVSVMSFFLLHYYQCNRYPVCVIYYEMRSVLTLKYTKMSLAGAVLRWGAAGGGTGPQIHLLPSHRLIQKLAGKM